MNSEIAKMRYQKNCRMTGMVAHRPCARQPPEPRLSHPLALACGRGAPVRAAITTTLGRGKLIDPRRRERLARARIVPTAAPHHEDASAADAATRRTQKRTVSRTVPSR
jgi:hypothetical protein